MAVDPAAPTAVLTVIPTSGMTAAWLAKLIELTQQVAILTAEKNGWALATGLQVSRPNYQGGGFRTYSGSAVRTVLTDLTTATATELAAAQTALHNCMAGL